MKKIRLMNINLNLLVQGQPEQDTEKDRGMRHAYGALQPKLLMFESKGDIPFLYVDGFFGGLNKCKGIIYWYDKTTKTKSEREKLKIFMDAINHVRKIHCGKRQNDYRKGFVSGMSLAWALLQVLAIDDSYDKEYISGFIDGLITAIEAVVWEWKND